MLCFAITVAPRYYEVSRYRKKGSLLRGLRYSEDSVITNYLVNNKSIRCSGVTKLKQAEQWDIHQAKQSTDLRVNSYDWIKQSFEGQSFHILTNRSLFGLSTICIKEHNITPFLILTPSVRRLMIQGM